MTEASAIKVRKLTTFRRTLQAIVLAGLPLAGCDSSGETNGCEPSEEMRELTLRFPTDASTRLKLESCRVDLDACMEVCREARTRLTPLPGSEMRLVGCDVDFFSDRAEVEMLLRFDCIAEGRRPGGLAPMTAAPAGDRAGAWLAQAAWLEAASIFAFVELARELEDRGAPAALARAALAAANDEIRHTQLMGALARRYGAAVPEPVVRPMAARSLEAMAIENAVEGCVRETWGALSAMWQARTAADPVARQVFAVIARDEVRHAQLAWSIEAWLAPRLSATARENVAAARVAAVAELRDGHEALPALGLPDADQARRMLARAHASLWKGALA